jgi:hypothetical protein
MVDAIEKDKMSHQQLIDSKGMLRRQRFWVEELPYLSFDAAGKLIVINPTEEQIIAQINK